MNAILLSMMLMTSNVDGADARAGGPEQLVPPGPSSYVLTDIFYVSTAVFGTLHLVDHALRNNHSGWPFTNVIGPTTAFTVVIPIIYGGALYFDGPLWAVIGDVIIGGGLIYAHGVAEPARDQHTPWANGTNVLETKAPAIGMAATLAAIGLNASVAGHLASSVADGFREGFTLRRNDPRFFKDAE